MHFLLLTMFSLLSVSELSNLQPKLIPQNNTLPSKPSCSNTPKTIAGRLKKTVFCGYDSSTRPVLHYNNQTYVRLAAFPASINDVYERVNIIRMTFWMYLEWNDDFLKWNRTEFDGKKDFEVGNSKIWTPVISIESYPQEPDFKISGCKVSAEGRVSCSMGASVLLPCDMDLTNFPYDSHSCNVAFGIKDYKGSELDLDFIYFRHTDPFKFYKPHNTWKIESYKSNRNTTLLYQEDYVVNLEYTFVILRQSSIHTIIYTTPAFVMIILTLCAFWLEVWCSARVILPTLSILTQIVVIQLLTATIQPNFNQIPIIIEFFQHSLLVAGLVLVWSVASLALSFSSSSPFWLYMATTSLTNKSFVKWIVPQDIFSKDERVRDEDTPAIQHHQLNWQIFILLLDRLLFSLFTFIYIILYFRMII